MHQTIATDQDAGRSNRGEQNSEHALLDCFLSETSRLAHSINYLVNNGGVAVLEVGIGAVDLGADEIEGEQLERALEDGLDNLGIGGVEGQHERLEDGFSVGGGEAVERGCEVRFGRVGEGLELVEGGFAC